MPKTLERLADFDRLSDLAEAAMSDLQKCEHDLQAYKIEMAGQYQSSTDNTGRQVVGFAGGIVALRFGRPKVRHFWNPSKSNRVAERDHEKLEALEWLAQGRVDLALERFHGMLFPKFPNTLIAEYATDANAWHDEMRTLIVWLKQSQF